MVRRLCRGLRGTALDYGCGYGDITDLLSEQLDIEGVDVGTERVEFAQQQYPELRFTVCREDGVDYPAAAFDVVVSSVVVPFVPSPDAYLNEIHRLLKPGGVLVVASKNIDVVRNLARTFAGRGPAVSKLHIMTPEGLEKRLENSGFKIEESDYFYDPPFQSPKNVADLCFSGIRLVGAIARIRSWAEYYGFRAVKVDRSLA